MRKTAITVLAVAALMVITLTAEAGSLLNWSKETTPTACGAKGAPIVNVTQRVTGDIDSGFNGGWAVDTYTRRIKMWRIGQGQFCVVVRYAGTFDALAGAKSPGQGSVSILDGNEKGNMKGGYRAVITGDLRSDPTWRTRGSVGRFDYACISVGNCPGAVDWVGQYFESGSSFQYQFWGWVYRGGRHGTWVNASTGSSGDIG